MLVQQVTLSHEADEFGDLVEGLPREDVHRRALAARRMHARAQRALSFWLLEIEKRRLYREFGCSSVFQYAELHLELAPHTIAEYLRTAREMERLPLLAEACARGDLSTAKLREISRVATPETEKAWVSIGVSSTYRQVEKLVPLTPRGGLPPGTAGNSLQAFPIACPDGELRVREIRECCIEGERGKGRGNDGECANAGEPGEGFGSEGEDGDREAPALDSSSLEGRPKCPPWPVGSHTSEDPCGDLIDACACYGHQEAPVRYRSKLVLELEHDRLALIMQAFSKARKETGLKERGALLEHISRAYLENQAAESCEGSPYRITFHHIPGTSVTWAEGGVSALRIPPSTLSEALCDAEILDLREEPPPQAPQVDLPRILSRAAQESSALSPILGEVARESTAARSGKGEEAPAAADAIPVGAAPWPRDPERHGKRLRSTIPKTLRRQVLARDMHQCSVPGCTHRVYLAIHHIKYYGEGGKDRLSNLTTVCSSCHRAIHRGMLSVQGEAPDRLVWRNARGEVLKGSSP
jgi:hypothetical protein